MKGIILAGGTGSRLYPMTQAISKHLLPVYDKPMIYYPLSTLMLTGIRDILIISNPQNHDLFQRLLGNGEQWGIHIEYAIQAKPEGIPQAFIIAEKFIGDQPVSLMLGDNIIYGQFLPEILREKSQISDGAALFAYVVRDPENYGVITFDKNQIPISIEEKPKITKSRYAVIGLYFYEPHVVEVAKSLRPSQRGELEISQLNQYYLEQQKLNVEILGRGIAWFDAGTIGSMMEASQFIQALETRQWLKIGCVEEVAWRMGYIKEHELFKLAELHPNKTYHEYLTNLI